MWDDVGLVNMGGRVYDPLIGRFLSPDPFIQEPSNLQSYNRYAYVLNNPLRYTDPTGYNFEEINFGSADVSIRFDPTIMLGASDLSYLQPIDFTSQFGLTSSSFEFQTVSFGDAAFEGITSSSFGSFTMGTLDFGGTLDFDEMLSASAVSAQSGDSSDAGPWYKRAWGSVRGAVGGAGRWVYNKATDWHFEGRDARNGAPPTYDQVRAQGSGWELLGPSQSIYHDNGVGQPELKYIHSSGREAVFNGDTLQPVTDPRYAGTYNYVNPALTPENWYNVGGWIIFTGRGAGHLVADLAPFWIGGNVRGNDPPPDPKP